MTSLEPGPHRSKARGQAGQLLQHDGSESPERLGAAGGELQPDDAVIVAILTAPDEPRVRGAVDELHCAVVAEEEVVGDVADRGTARITMAPDRQQQLVLCRRDALGLRSLFAPTQEPAETGAELEQALVFGVADPSRAGGGGARHEKYRITI